MRAQLDLFRLVKTYHNQQPYHLLLPVFPTQPPCPQRSQFRPVVQLSIADTSIDGSTKRTSLHAPRSEATGTDEVEHHEAIEWYFAWLEGTLTYATEIAQRVSYQQHAVMPLFRQAVPIQTADILGFRDVTLDGLLRLPHLGRSGYQGSVRNLLACHGQDFQKAQCRSSHSRTLVSQEIPPRYKSSASQLPWEAQQYQGCRRADDPTPEGFPEGGPTPLGLRVSDAKGRRPCPPYWSPRGN